MALRQDWSAHPCPIARSLDVLGDPWVMLILREAFTGTRRFEKFRSHLEIADNVLSKRLQLMVDAGLLERSAYRGEQRSHNEYLLTAAGTELLPLLHTLAIWGERHTAAPQRRAHMTILHTECGQVTTSAEICSNCRVELTAQTTQWKRQWISRNPVELQAAQA
jgi:DNA-binding HxlR family transcriptional regulator